MRILYVAKHGPRDNQDEDAITHALTLLGHEVIAIPENNSWSVKYESGDFILYHGWADPSRMRRCTSPKVMWYFDLVQWPDPTLEPRNQARLNRIHQVMPETQLAFHTDGDWVEKTPWPEKTLWLPQGMDERVAGPGKPYDRYQYGVVFTGTTKGGIQRASHLRELQDRYGSRFKIFGDGRIRVHGRNLADLYASATVVLAPDAPVTDRYWSNRVYNTLGLGGFLLHPFAQRLAEQYQDEQELVFYSSRDECNSLIEFYLDHPEQARVIGLSGYQKTMECHTYRHRCEQLVQTVKERLL